MTGPLDFEASDVSALIVAITALVTALTHLLVAIARYYLKRKAA